MVIDEALTPEPVTTFTAFAGRDDAFVSDFPLFFWLQAARIINPAKPIKAYFIFI
jgi:hypothetical protein